MGAHRSCFTVTCQLRFFVEAVVLNPGHSHNETVEQDVYKVSLCDVSWQSTNIHRSASRLGEAWVVRERVLDMLFVLLNAGKVAFTIDTNNQSWCPSLGTDAASRRGCL